MQVILNDPFLGKRVEDSSFTTVPLRDEFLENARLFIFETYCRMHQCIDIGWVLCFCIIFYKSPLVYVYLLVSYNEVLSLCFHHILSNAHCVFSTFMYNVFLSPLGRLNDHWLFNLLLCYHFYFPSTALFIMTTLGYPLDANIFYLRDIDKKGYDYALCS